MAQPVTNTAPELIEGEVIFFNDAKGFGFIRRADGVGPWVYVHYAHIKGQADRQALRGRTLLAGQRVRFELADRGKGPMALHCEVVSGPRVVASFDGRTA